jgi:hypothetical protein
MNSCSIEILGLKHAALLYDRIFPPKEHPNSCGDENKIDVDPSYETCSGPKNEN